MPQAAAHILIPLVLVSIFRDFYVKKNDRNNFPLHYVLIAGIAGIIPDLDIVAFWVLHFFGYSINEVHRTIAHTLFIPLIFVSLGIITSKVKLNELGKHKLKLNIIFYCLAFGSFMHLVLDGIFQGYIMPLFPFIKEPIGLNLFGFFPSELYAIAAPSLDAGLLILYIIYLEWRHKISDFI
jgi:hypothetical protein